MCDVVGVRVMVKFLAKLFFINGEINNPVTIGSLKLWGYIPFLVVGFFVSSPLWVSMFRVKLAEFTKKHDAIMMGVSDLYLIAVLIVSLVFLMGGTYNPFIYFRF